MSNKRSTARITCQGEWEHSVCHFASSAWSPRSLPERFKYMLSIRVSASTICKALRDQRFSRKRMQLVARQRWVPMTCSCCWGGDVCDAEMLVFLDETGSDRRNGLRRHGYGWRGNQLSHKLLVRGEHISCISMKGMLECTTVTNSVEDPFYAFVHSKLLPLLMPFNEKNPHSVIMMDSASIHHVDGIMHLITGVGALIFLPPYPPIIPSLWGRKIIWICWT